MQTSLWLFLGSVHSINSDVISRHYLQGSRFPSLVMSFQVESFHLTATFFPGDSSKKAVNFNISVILWDVHSSCVDMLSEYLWLCASGKSSISGSNMFSGQWWWEAGSLFWFFPSGCISSPGDDMFSGCLCREVGSSFWLCPSKLGLTKRDILSISYIQKQALLSGSLFRVGSVHLVAMCFLCRYVLMTVKQFPLSWHYSYS